jgi:cysteine desulfurase
MKIYLDNAATTQVAPEVMKVIEEYCTEKYGNASSLHSFGREARDALEKARAVIAKSINAEPDEIIFTASGTEADNMAIKEIAFQHLKDKNHIITSKIEHPAVLETCRFLEKMGFEIKYLDVDREGFVDLKQLEDSITNKTCLVSIMHANNEIGTIQPIDKIGEICRKKGVIFHTDAVQSFTKVPIDVKKIKVDLISLSGHKIHGPKGIGVLYKRKNVKIGALIHGGGHEFGLRSGTENVAGAAGFAKAVELVKKEDIEKMKKLRDKLIDGLMKIPETILNGSKDKRLCNNVNVAFKYIEGEALVLRLDDEGIAASTGSACSSKSLLPSHVLLAIGLKPQEAHGSLRLTLSRYTTEKEIDYALKIISQVVEELRKISPLWREK